MQEGSCLGLNAALSLGAAEASRQGAARVLFIPADLPFATAAEIGEVTEAPRLSQPHAVIVPDREGAGTNALLLSPPDILGPRFGPRSFDRHCEAAHAQGVRVRVLRPEGLGVDIDEPVDLALLARRARELPRYRFLDEAAELPAAVTDSRVGVAEP